MPANISFLAFRFRFHTFIQKYASMQIKPRNRLTAAVCIWGQTGLGKTAQICQNYAAEDLYWKPHGPWWDGYEQQPVVVFDEFYSWYPYGDTLRLLDRFPLKVPVKGAFQEFTSEIVFFTSNQNPASWFKNIPNKAALWRRMSLIIHIEDNGRKYLPLHTVSSK